jgi:hypothetical protein
MVLLKSKKGHLMTTTQTTREKIKSKIEYKLSLSKNELVEETIVESFID